MQWHNPATSLSAPSEPLPDLSSHLAYLAELARQATVRSMKNPIRAEIIPNTTPAWHVLSVQPGHERLAAGHLVARGFGVYLPEFTKTSICRGRKTSRTLPIFPTYLFLFVWGIDHQWRRITTCPGIVRALSPYGDDRPTTVPDRIIDHIQAAETELMLHGGVVERAHMIERKKKRPRRKKKAERIKDLDLPAGIELGPTQELVTISTKSYFADVGVLDDTGRNSLLLKALGLV